MRRRVIYGFLAVAWLAIAGWQALEHERIWESARRGLASRAHDLSAALSVVIRSQGRVALIPKPRLEAALYELVHSTELESVVLLNASGEVTASAGRPMDVDTRALLRTHEHWSRDSASFANLVALGPGTEGSEGIAAVLPLDVPRNGDGRRPYGGRNMPREPGDFPPGPMFDPSLGEADRDTLPRDPEDLLRGPMLDPILTESNREALLGMMGDKPLTAEQVDSILGLFREGVISEHRAETLRRTLAGRPLDRAMLEDVLMMAAVPRHPPGPPPKQPPWMSREDYDQLLEERGVHWFLVTMPTGPFRAEMAADFRLRGIVAGVALLACLALGWAWRAFERSSNLEIQLVRAHETANRLRELNVTAAGLVHETKNPLNLIRGLAQMISRERDIPGTMRSTAVKITEEADRVTGRLNQFLDYARPAQPDPKPLSLNALVKGIFEVLACDREEKSVTLDVNGPELSVRADENMLRQMLFNLLLNAVQAVPDGGRVEVRLAKDTDVTARVEVRDNGPGVPPKDREEIFRPYFTTSEDGTGLGLAVVRQLALAHEWEVACLPSESGAVFRVRGIALAREDPARTERG